MAFQVMNTVTWMTYGDQKLMTPSIHRDFMEALTCVPPIRYHLSILMLEHLSFGIRITVTIDEPVLLIKIRVGCPISCDTRITQITTPSSSLSFKGIFIPLDMELKVLNFLHFCIFFIKMSTILVFSQDSTLLSSLLNIMA